VGSDLTSMIIKWNGGPTIPSSTAEISVTGYKLYMDGGDDGDYKVIYDGSNLPGNLDYRVTADRENIIPGKAYRFKVAGINFNGEGPASASATLFMCLSPYNMTAPTYASSSSTSLTINWSPPVELNGCPISYYEVYRDTGANDAITVQVGGQI